MGGLFLSPDMASGQDWGKDFLTPERTRGQMVKTMEKEGGLTAGKIIEWK